MELIERDYEKFEMLVESDGEGTVLDLLGQGYLLYWEIFGVAYKAFKDEKAVRGYVLKCAIVLRKPYVNKVKKGEKRKK